MEKPVNPIVSYRKQRNMSRKTLATILGISVNVLERYESSSINFTNLRLNTIIKLANTFNLTYSELVEAFLTYMEKVKEYGVQNLNIDCDEEIVRYTCLAIYYNLTSRIVGAKIKNQTTGEIKVVNRDEIILLSNSNNVKIDGLTVSKIGSLRVRRNIKAFSTDTYDNEIPENIK